MTGILLREFRHSPQCCTHIRETCEDTEKTSSTQHGVRPQRIQPCPHLDPRLPASRTKEIRCCLSRTVCGVLYGTQKTDRMGLSRLLTLDPFWALCVGWGRVQSILFHVDNPVVPAPLSCERTKVKQPLCPFSINSLEDTLKYHGQFCRFKPVVFKIWVSGTLCTLLKITKMLSHKAGNGGSCL